MELDCQQLAQLWVCMLLSEVSPGTRHGLKCFGCYEAGRYITYLARLCAHACPAVGEGGELPPELAKHDPRLIEAVCNEVGCSMHGFWVQQPATAQSMLCKACMTCAYTHPAWALCRPGISHARAHPARRCSTCAVMYKYMRHEQHCCMYVCNCR